MRMRRWRQGNNKNTYKADTGVIHTPQSHVWRSRMVQVSLRVSPAIIIYRNMILKKIFLDQSLSHDDIIMLYAMLSRIAWMFMFLFSALVCTPLCKRLGMWHEIRFGDEWRINNTSFWDCDYADDSRYLCCVLWRRIPPSVVPLLLIAGKYQLQIQPRRPTRRFPVSRMARFKKRYVPQNDYHEDYLCLEYRDLRLASRLTGVSRLSTFRL